jgi:hypothetical protein
MVLDLLSKKAGGAAVELRRNKISKWKQRGRNPPYICGCVEEIVRNKRATCVRA